MPRPFDPVANSILRTEDCPGHAGHPEMVAGKHKKGQCPLCRSAAYHNNPTVNSGVPQPKPNKT